MSEETSKEFLNDGVNRVRTEEHRRLLKEGDEGLKGTPWFWLHSEDELTEADYVRFRDSQGAALKTSQARFLKEAFRFFWGVPRTAAAAAGDYFATWDR